MASSLLGHLSRSALMVGAAWLAATAAFADAAKPPNSTVAPVTVQGVAPPAMIEDQALSFARTFPGATTELDQIARWRDPVCFKAVGHLTDDQAKKVETRLGEVAAQVGLKVRPAGCSPNIEIVFTDKPQAVMDVVARRNEQLLGYYHRHDNKQLRTVTHPIQAWYVTATMGGGASAGFSRNLHAEVIDDPDNDRPDGCGDSPHFTACLQSNFKNVFVVVDTHALEGKDIGLVSDYLAMVTLAAPKALDGCHALPSVIDLTAKSDCGGREAPNGLTPGDAAYLTALYQADPEGRKWVQEGDIAGRMAKMLIASTKTPAH
jgi:hypothetical protein